MNKELSTHMENSPEMNFQSGFRIEKDGVHFMLSENVSDEEWSSLVDWMQGG